MSTENLSVGAIKALTSEKEFFLNNQIFQVLRVGKLSIKEEDIKDFNRYRATLSDGESSILAVLPSESNQQIISGEIREFSIIQVEQVRCETIKERKILLCTKTTLCRNMEGKIENPISLSRTQASQKAEGSSIPRQSTSLIQTQGYSSDPYDDYDCQDDYVNPFAVMFGLVRPPFQENYFPLGNQITPITYLNPFVNSWSIHCSVSFKSDLREYSRNGKTGKVFNAHLIDATGEIKATGFNGFAEQFYPMLEVGKSYYISGLRINTANKLYTSLAHDFELMFGHYSTIRSCLETLPTPNIYNFIKIDKINDLPLNSNIDVVGVVKGASSLSKVFSKKHNKEITKRDIILVDSSMKAVRLTLWGLLAEEFLYGEGVVIACKSVKLSEFHGKCLSSTLSTSVQSKPDFKEGSEILKWWRSLSHDAKFEPLNENDHISIGASIGGFDIPFKSLCDVNNDPSFARDKEEWFNVIAIILFIRDNPVYPACPQVSCRKKIVPRNGFWFCEKCNLSFPQPDYRYFMNCCISDFYTDLWVQMSDEQGSMVFKGPASHYEAQKSNHSQLNMAHANAYFRLFNFTIAARKVIYNGAPKMTYFVKVLCPFDSKSRANILFDEIDKFLSDT